jgi:hypothetical protein|tara:strand:+ start:153 stop:575 length:423 start_codon:yes stop_codon:yes gene_type:complete
MTTLTIIKDDGFVKVDGYGIQPIDCSSLAANIHAIQFDGTNGHVEYNDGTNNEAITSISAYSAITDLWTSTKATVDAEESEAATAQTNLEATYGWKRQYDETTKYATIGDQLDQQYKDAVNGTTTWKDAITAVKSAHPKP